MPHYPELVRWVSDLSGFQPQSDRPFNLNDVSVDTPATEPSFAFRYSLRVTLTLDDELVARAQSLTGLQKKSALIREALKQLIAREAGRRLARLGGTEPQAKAPPRRRNYLK